MTKVPARILVAIEDLAKIPNDHFIKDLYVDFSKRVPSSTLRVGVVDRTLADSKLYRNKDLVMPAEGAPDMVADIPDDHGKRLPQVKVCNTSN